MKKVTVIGLGNVGTHLCVALADVADEVISVDSRTLEDLPEDSDLYLIAVSDRAIADVAARLPRLRGVVAHTSGSVPMDVLAPHCDRYGVFYPLQTFSKADCLDYHKIPVFIEASDPASLQTLSETASLFSGTVREADSALRARLHVASVFAANFANHLWAIADTLLQRDGLDISVLRPLIEASVAKLRYMTPAQAQTGPASRGDQAVIASHLEALSDTPYAQIYSLLTDSIIKTKEENEQHSL